MEWLPDLENRQLFLLPLVLALYTQRNLSLVHLAAFTAPDSAVSTTIHPDVLDSFRSDDLLSNVEPFLNGIAALSCLQTLEFFHIPFIAVDIVPRLLDTLGRLPHLRTLNLNPEPATEREADVPVELPLAVLQAISQKHCRLTRLEVSVDIPRNLPEPPATTSTHGLKRLGLQPSSIDYANFKTEDKFKLARYISRLFPRAEIIEYDRSPEETEFWAFIN